MLHHDNSSSGLIGTDELISSNITYWMLYILNGRQRLVCTLWCGEWANSGTGDGVVRR